MSFRKKVPLASVSSRALSVAGVAAVAALALAAVRGDESRPSGRALLLSDIHFDPLALGTDVGRLRASRIEAWDAILAPTLQQPFPALATPSQWRDSNYPLFESALAGADGHEPYDFVVVAGDVLRHDFDDQPPEFIAKTAGYVAQKVQREFGVPTIFAIGNNDGTVHNQAKPNDPVFAAIADQLTVFRDDPEAKRRFAYGGYCRLRHPTVPKEDILVLNSVFWSAKYAADPAAGPEEMDWLAARLGEAAKRGRRTTLVMHIPPGIDVFSTLGKTPPAPTPLWNADRLASFTALMRRHAGTVRSLIAGHLHMDDFRAMDLGNSRSLPMRITPSISPSNGNNPAFAALDYDRKTGEMRDATTYFTNLVSPAGTPYVPLLPWGREYRFSSAFGGRSPFRGGDLRSLSEAVRANGPEADSWRGYYSVLAPNAVTDATLRYYACGQTAMTPEAYTACVGP